MSSLTPMNVFLIGPGFIGEAVLQLLAQNAYHVTVLVRDQSAAAHFSGREIKTVFATLDNSKLIEDAVFNHDIVIHTASSRHLASAMAVLAGIQRRHDAGHETIYIHTSGATHLADDSAGSFRGSTVFDDENPEQLNRLSDKKSRVVDLAILRHRKTLGPNAKIAILTPPVVYGVGEGSGRLSIQLPTLVRYSLNHGYAGQIGRGLSVWNHIHVKDLARGYMEILKWMQKTPGNDVQMNPWWFCENGEEISWNECSSAVGEALYRIGLISDPLPQTVPSMNYGELFGDYSETVLGSNSRNRASRLRKLGWKPQEKTSLASLFEDEIPVILKNVPVLHKK